MNTISLNEKEKLFCRYYADLLNPKEAALRAGYSPKMAEKAAYKLLTRSEISAEIEEHLHSTRQGRLLEQAVTGLLRLAFGNTNDAALLALTHSELDQDAIEALDLYSIAELKKHRDGGFEVKFADRLKAIEALVSIARQLQPQEDTAGFLEALMGCAEEEKKDGAL